MLTLISQYNNEEYINSCVYKGNYKREEHYKKYVDRQTKKYIKSDKFIANSLCSLSSAFFLLPSYFIYLLYLFILSTFLYFLAFLLPALSFFCYPLHLSLFLYLFLLSYLSFSLCFFNLLHFSYLSYFLCLSPSPSYSIYFVLRTISISPVPRTFSTSFFLHFHLSYFTIFVSPTSSTPLPFHLYHLFLFPSLLHPKCISYLWLSFVFLALLHLPSSSNFSIVSPLLSTIPISLLFLLLDPCFFSLISLLSISPRVFFPYPSTPLPPLPPNPTTTSTPQPHHRLYQCLPFPPAATPRPRAEVLPRSRTTTLGTRASHRGANRGRGGNSTPSAWTWA